MTPPTRTPVPRIGLARRYGPVAVILAGVVVAAVLASTGDTGTTRAVAGGGPASTAPVKASELPTTWEEAKEAGTTDQLRWNANCDRKTGRIRYPSVYAPPCVAAPQGVKGGATSPGVTADTITVALYQPADDDLAATLQGVSDPPAKATETRQDIVKMLNDVYDTWGRKVVVKVIKGSGSDETKSRADAIKVAEEYKAFASLGGPSQTPAYADELVKRGVLCIECGLGVPDKTYQEDAPYLWGSLQSPEQFLINVGDYLVYRLNKRKAEFAGDPKLRSRQRVFGVVHFEQDPPVFSGLDDTMAKAGAKVGYKTKVNLTYTLDLSRLGEEASSMISKLKAEKVTTVVFLGDPIMPIYLSKAATAQNYFPEWVVTGTVLTDATALARLYDQEQWAHAFGVSSLPARIPQQQSDAYRIYEWYYGKEPPGPKTIGVSYPNIQQFMLGVHMAGPNLTPDTFREGLFKYPPSGGGLTTPHVSYGRHGYFPDPDYISVDDMTEIWYDATAKGEDEQQKEGTGMYRYVDGGKRYLPHQMPHTAPRAFIRKGSVTMYDTPPKADRPPEYPSPGPGGKGKGGG